MTSLEEVDAAIDRRMRVLAEVDHTEQSRLGDDCCEGGERTSDCCAVTTSDVRVRLAFHPDSPLDVDKATVDFWTLRRDGLVRLVGVHPMEVRITDAGRQRLAATTTDASELPGGTR